MPVYYQFSFRDGTGTQIALLSGSQGGLWHSLAYDHIENGVGRATLVIDGRLGFIQDLTDRTILKIKRKLVRGRGAKRVVIDWYDEWEGMLDYIHDGVRDDKNTVRLEFGSYLDMIRARYIKYNSLTPYTVKSGPGETVIKELVNENAGPGAISPPRYVNGVTSGLVIEADAGRGNPWQGSHAGVPLLDTITRIGNGTDIFFDIVSTGPAAFEFRCYYLQRGVNRARIGIDRTTGGLNLYGYAPVVFALDKKNMDNPSRTTNYRDSLSSVTYVGQGSDEDSLHQNRMNAADMVRSPWSVREGLIRSGSDYTEESLLYGANEAIVANRAKTTLDFDVLQVDSCLYGKDYTWGDVVTGIFKGEEFTKRISSVGVQVQGLTETIKPVLLEV